MVYYILLLFFFGSILFVSYKLVSYFSNKKREKIYLCLDFFLEKNPQAVFQVYRRFKNEFIDDPVLKFNIVYANVIGEILETLTISFQYCAYYQKYVGKMNFKLHNNTGITNLHCSSYKMPLIKLHSPFYHIISEVETTSQLPVSLYCNSANDEYDRLFFK